MTKTIQILGHTVEYECELDLLEQRVVSNVLSRIMAGHRKGEIEFCRNELIYILTWRIVEPKVLEVIGCGNCPFRYDEYGYGCNHIDGTRNLYDNTDEVFASCPLKKESITIKLKSNEQQSVYGC